ncbi:MAG: nuclear transport factor 2 family protein [Sphingobium sp.]|nr:nuclear transport factor 2 family protein [Sphingobium sp.]
MTERNLTTEAANKQIVLDMWYHVICRRDLAAAPRYIAQDYIQHSPSTGQGLAALIDFLKAELGGGEPREAAMTPFELVMAEGDLVQLMFKRPIPDPHRPGETAHVWWHDSYRVKDGLIVEHWDSAIQ